MTTGLIAIAAALVLSITAFGTALGQGKTASHAMDVCIGKYYLCTRKNDMVR